MIETLASPIQPDSAAGRVLHLIDVENLLAGPSFSRVASAVGRVAYEAVAPCGAMNQVVIATSHHAAAEAWFAWPPSARRLVRSGPTGADSALIEVVATEQLERRFDRVVIGSGDGIFAFPAARLQAAGVVVTVVTRRECLSRALRLAVRDIRFITAVERTISRGAMVA